MQVIADFNALIPQDSTEVDLTQNGRKILRLKKQAYGAIGFLDNPDIVDEKQKVKEAFIALKIVKFIFENSSQLLLSLAYENLCYLYMESGEEDLEHSREENLESLERKVMQFMT